jgi:hypothetical protein
VVLVLEASIVLARARVVLVLEASVVLVIESGLLA